MANIVFTDPPPNAGRDTLHPWTEIAETLKQRPGEWALCLRGIHSSYVSQINHGRLVAFKPAGAFEARGVTSTLPAPEGKRTHDLYIRYIGTPETANDD